MRRAYTILGCGSSGGVPRVGAGWGACDPTNPKNRRLRCSLLVRQIDGGGQTTVLVDTSPDLREQLITAKVDALDAILFTHPHADHTHGIDDLRPMAIHQRRRLDAYLDMATAETMHARFGYCFETPLGSPYPPILTEHRIEPGKAVTITGAGGPLTVLPFLQDHGDMTSLGFRFDDVAYSSDLRDLPPESLPILDGISVWIVDALRYRPHPTHFSVDDALCWIERIKPKRAILTNLHSDLDYDELRARLPPHVEPAYDGLTLIP